MRTLGLIGSSEFVFNHVKDVPCGKVVKGDAR